MNIKMTNEQFSRVYDVFFKDRESSSMKRYFMLPSLFVSETGKSAYLQDEAICDSITLSQIKYGLLQRE